MRARPARVLSLSEAIQVAVQQNLGITLYREQCACAGVGGRSSGASRSRVVHAVYSASEIATPPPLSLLQNGDNAVVPNAKGGNWYAGVSQTLEPLDPRSDTGVPGAHPSGPGSAPPAVHLCASTSALTQPLLKSFAFDLDVPRPTSSAPASPRSARKDARLTIIATVHATDDAYWDLVGALRNSPVERESLRLADEQLALTKRQIDSGVLATADLISAESTQAQRASRLFQAEGQIDSAADVLRHGAQPSPGRLGPPAPADRSASVRRAEREPRRLTRRDRNRPEGGPSVASTSRGRRSTCASRRRSLPELDTTFTYGLVGQQTGYADTLNQVFSANVPAWTRAVST